MIATTTVLSGDSHREMAVSKGKENTTPRQCWQTKVILSIGHWLQCLGQRQRTWKQCSGGKKTLNQSTTEPEDEELPENGNSTGSRAHHPFLLLQL